MELGKLNVQPPLIAAFCLCTIFILLHYVAAPTEPKGFGPAVYGASDALARSELRVLALEPHEQLPKREASFVAVRKGVASKAVLDDSQLAKQEVKKMQKLVKQEEYLEKKERGHMKGEETNLKKEEKLLHKLKAAISPGDKKAYSKMVEQLDKLAKSEQRDASIADKVVIEERKQQQQLADLFGTWANSVKHPGSKWGAKHEQVVKEERKAGHNLESLAQHQSLVEKQQANFLEQRQAFEQSRRTP